MGISARRRRLQAAAHGQGRRRRHHRRLPGARRLHRRAPHSRRPARHGRGHVHRRGSQPPVRPPGRTLGAGRNLVQVPCLLPPHPPGRRCAAAGPARQQPDRGRHRTRRRPRTPGRHRRARPRRESADRAPVQVLHGHRPGPDRPPGPRGPGRIRRGPGRSRRGQLPRQGRNGAGSGSRRRLSATLDRQGHRLYARRPQAA
ncbi:hypothetical protein FQZ97_935150 [compost metagenome]